MSRAWNIIIAVGMWAAIVAYMAAATRYSRAERAGIDVSEVRIAVNDSSSTKVISPAMVSRWIREGGFELVGRPIDEVDTRAVEEYIARRPEVARVSAWTDLNGRMTVQVSQRTPIMRIRSSNGYRFWVTGDNYILPDRGDFPAYVPVVTGNTPFPFSTAASGSYDGMVEAAYRDFLGQYTEMEGERRSLTAQRSSKRAGIRAERAKRTKRFWSRERKNLFNEAKSRRIAELQEEVVALDAALAALAVKKEALGEKEKKSQQSHLFLTKLINFVKSIENDGFWSAQIVQINVLGGGTEGGTGLWKEPQLELVPRAGDHIVLLGRLDGQEGEKLEKLKLFYLNGLWHEGWDEFCYINIKYKGQIVCTK